MADAENTTNVHHGTKDVCRWLMLQNLAMLPTDALCKARCDVDCRCFICSLGAGWPNVRKETASKSVAKLAEIMQGPLQRLNQRPYNKQAAPRSTGPRLNL